MAALARPWAVEFVDAVIRAPGQTDDAWDIDFREAVVSKKDGKMTINVGLRQGAFLAGGVLLLQGEVLSDGGINQKYITFQKHSDAGTFVDAVIRAPGQTDDAWDIDFREAACRRRPSASRRSPE